MYSIWVDLQMLSNLMNNAGTDEYLIICTRRMNMQTLHNDNSEQSQLGLDGEIRVIVCIFGSKFDN